MAKIHNRNFLPRKNAQNFLVHLRTTLDRGEPMPQLFEPQRRAAFVVCDRIESCRQKQRHDRQTANHAVVPRANIWTHLNKGLAEVVWENIQKHPDSGNFTLIQGTLLWLNPDS